MPLALAKERDRERDIPISETRTIFHTPRKPHNIWWANRPGGLTVPYALGRRRYVCIIYTYIYIYIYIYLLIYLFDYLFVYIEEKVIQVIDWLWYTRCFVSFCSRSGLDCRGSCEATCFSHGLERVALRQRKGFVKCPSEGLPMSSYGMSLWPRYLRQLSAPATNKLSPISSQKISRLRSMLDVAWQARQRQEDSNSDNYWGGGGVACTHAAKSKFHHSRVFSRRAHAQVQPIPLVTFKGVLQRPLMFV